MTVKLKSLAFALLAALAASVATAPAASAESFHFGSSAEITELDGGGILDDTFTFDVGQIKCADSEFIGLEAGKKLTDIEVLPTYTGCKTSLGIAAPIDRNSCGYEFYVVTKQSGNFEGAMDLICPSKPMEVTGPGCTVTVPAQEGLGKITYTNAGLGDITIDISITGLKYEEHTKGVFPTCVGHTTQKVNGTYLGQVLMTGGSANLSVTP